ncbi:SET domain-containing protein-lysine N-methyltransferase [Wolbachia endosymbiont of Frankliniella intonsa]|uniref:SET domain-containing protein-lysine N-methyltransferase n=1 Tax=Wolbachia endosymbiont of Frankliniella intonsa TaxID=2902422 RepID=UPI00244E6340|nr:SET domain-containing protein-lysine N-methyltransferase [Wolbachia endosymbiont of Frankliniella intonsa]WGJ61852.1 SET domain-containing protein-lysine N-methyltransferase [Wolbachia endosymbiont of Frankliniella intonsa]
MGVFAKDEIKAGTFLGTFAGERMSQDENLESLYVFNVGKKTIIDGEKKRNWASYLNHGSINNVNLQHFIEKFQNKGQVTFYAKVDISPNSQLLFDYGEGYFSKLGNYNPIYLHPTDNDLTPSQRYNSVKDVYYDHVIELDEKIAQGLGYSREKYFVVPKLFQKIYNNEDISDDKTLSKGLNTPIYAVKLNGDKKWEFYSYDKQQQATSLMLACYSGREGSVKSLLRENSIDITRSTLHGGRNALFFTILSDTDDKGTKESILGFLVNKIKDLYKSNKVNEYVSELLYAPDGSGKNLFDHMMDKGEYSLYKAYYEKSSKPWQKKVAEEYIADQGILSIVLSLGTQEHVEVIDALLKRLSASFTRTCLKNDVKDKENVDYRKEQLSKLKQLTNLSEAMKKEMIEILEEKYGSSTDEKELETSDQHSQIEKRRKVFGHNLAATDEKELETSDQHSQIEKRRKVFSRNLAAREIFSPDINELKLLESTVVSKGETFPNWVDVGRDRLKGWGSRSKKIQSIEEYLAQFKPGIDKFLDLSNIGLEDCQVQELTEFLKANKNVEIDSLDFSSNNLSPEGAVELINALIESKQGAFSLDLSNNDIGSYGSKSQAIALLAKLIRSNKITHLIINDIGLITPDYSKIFGALKSNTSIEKLDLSGNYVSQGFSKRIAKQIARGLHNHPKLVSLNLSETGITDSVMEDVVKYCTESSIKELDIGNNEITEEGMDSLVKLVQQFRELESLKLYDNFIGEGIKS